MPGLYFDSGISKGFEKDIEKMNSRLNQFSRNVKYRGDEIDETFGKIKNTVSGVVTVMAIGAAGKELVDFSRNLETALIEVATISETVTKDFEGYKNQIIAMSTEQDLAASSAEQLARAFYDIVSAGNDGADGIAVLEASARASTAGFVEAQVAADGITTVINAWGYEASKAAQISDIFFKTVEKGKTTFPELGANIAKVAPLAASMGISFEEVSGAIASITKQGTRTPEALTQIRASMIAMTKVLGDGWRESMNFQEGLQAIRDKAAGSQNELKKLLGTDEAVLAVLALTGKNAKMAAKDLDAMNDSLGATEAAAQKVVDTTTHQIKTLKNNILAAFAPLGNEATSIIADLAKKLNASFETGSFKDFLDILKILIRTLLVYKGSVIALTAVKRIQTAAEYQNIRAQKLSALTGRKVTAANILLAKSMRTITAAFAANPIGLLVTGLTLAIPLIGRWIKKTDEATGSEEAFNDQLERGNELINERRFFDLENVFVEAGVSLNNFANDYDKVLDLVKKNFDYEKDGLELLKEKIGLRLKALQLQKLEVEEDVPAIGDQVQTLQGLITVTKEYQEQLKARNKEHSKIFDDEINAQQSLLAYLNSRVALLEKEQKEQNVDKLQQLKIANQRERNAIIEHYDGLEGEQKEYQIKLLENELNYLRDLKKLTEDELEGLEIEEKVLKIKAEIINVKQATDEIDELIQAELAGLEIQDPVLSLDVEYDSFKQALEVIADLNQVIQSTISSLDGMDESSKNILEGTLNTAEGVLGLIKAVDLLGDSLTALETSSVVLLAISSILKIITAINNTISKQLEIREQKYIDELSMVHAVNLAIIEQNRLYAEGNEFFTTDKWGTALNALNTYNLSLSYQKELLDEIAGTTKGLPDDPNLLTGWGGTFAAIREAYDIKKIQDDAQSYATVLEKALASVSVKTKDRGGFANFFGFKDSFQSLLEVYPNVISANNELDATVLKTIIDTADLSDAERARLQQLLDLTVAAQEAYAAFGDYISSIFGGVADEVTQAFQEMYEGGDDAMINLQESFSNMIESFTRDAIEFALLQPLLNQLNSITKALGEEFAKGDISADELQTGIINALGDFYASLNELQPEILRAYENADRLAEEAGFAEAFNPQELMKDVTESVAGQVQRAITEETGSMLVGRLGAIMLSNERIANYNVDMLDYAVQNLIYMRQIKLNTDYLPQIADNTRKTYERLESI